MTDYRYVGARPPGWYVGLLAIALVIAFSLATLLDGPRRHMGGIPPGSRLPPFAVPLADGHIVGEADVATHPNDGTAGRVPACDERGPEILNVCELYEHSPVVIALFVDEGGCTKIVADLQRLSREFPHVRFAAVALNGDRRALRALIRKEGLTIPIGIDLNGRVATLYQLVSCPQLDFANPGGIVQSPPLLTRPSARALRARVQALAAAAHVAVTG